MKAFAANCIVLTLTALLALAAPAQAQMGLGAVTGGSSGTSESQDAPVLPEDLTPEIVDDLVARMSDDQVRALLLERLDAVAQQQTIKGTPQQSSLVTMGENVQKMLLSWVDVLRKVPSLISNQARAFTNFGEVFGSDGLMKLFGYIFLALAVGFAAEKLVGLWTRRWIKEGSGPDHVLATDQELESATPSQGRDLKAALGFLARRFARELLGLVVFYYTVAGVARAIMDEQQITFIAPFAFYLIWVPRISAAVSRFVIAPHRADLRMVNISDHWGTYLHRHMVGLFVLVGFTLFIVRFNELNGVAMEDIRLGFWLNLAIHVYIGLIAWNAREGLSDVMLGSDPDRTRFDEFVAANYPYFVIGVSAVMWLTVEYLAATGNPELLALAVSGAHFITIFWLLAAPGFDALIRGLVRYLQPPMAGTGAIAIRAYKSTKRSFIRIGRVLAGLFVVLQIAKVWNIDLRTIAGAGTDAGGAVIQFFTIVSIGYIINECVSLWINRRLAKEQTELGETAEEDAGEGGGAGGSRLSTVLPLLRVTAQVAIAVIFGLLALGALGVDITPLLAGAGILGLAIGFGAQKLVSDIVSGIFFLIDDAFRVGEYVEIGATRGAVEKISIRSMQLRHHRGPVHTIPYGEIPQLTNYSRDWVIMKLRFTVPFDTDPNKVKKIFKKIGAEMLQEDLFKDDFLQPFKSQGVFEFDDVGMVVRGKFMAKPGKQFTIRKEVYNRVKREFDAAGIEFARREVRVAIPGLENTDDMSEVEKTAIGAPAADLAHQQQVAQDKAKGS